MEHRGKLATDVSPGMHWVSVARRQLSLMLLLKVMMLGLLWYWFFSSPHRPPGGSAAVAQRLVPPGDTQHEKGVGHE